jgi:adenosylhomocysteine nucleosidase
LPSPPLITFAVPAEAAPAHRTFQQRQLPARFLVTGIGAHAARGSLLQALAGSRPPFVLTCGFAGGLNPTLPRGTLVYEADPDFPLANRLPASGARSVRFLGSDRILSTAWDKAAAREQSGADAVEMESFAIRELCREHNVSSATFRVISDTAQEDLPMDFSCFLSVSGRFRYEKLAVALLLSPTRIPPLIRFQRQTRHAANALAEGLLALFHFDVQR